MASPRFQFRLSTLLWITLAVACFCGGSAWQRQRTGLDNFERREKELKVREKVVEAKWEILAHYLKQGIPPTVPLGKKQHTIRLGPHHDGEVIFESSEGVK
ncbi:MAG TPA: hypothetical protein VND64_21125 [Pirellulales bacterium]|nr:hypothetical protein [Pirellulales bacterium]